LKATNNMRERESEREREQEGGERGDCVSRKRNRERAGGTGRG
jgi:hypothetical protein